MSQNKTVFPGLGQEGDFSPNQYFQTAVSRILALQIKGAAKEPSILEWKPPTMVGLLLRGTAGWHNLQEAMANPLSVSYIPYREPEWVNFGPYTSVKTLLAIHQNVI